MYISIKNLFWVLMLLGGLIISLFAAYNLDSQAHTTEWLKISAGLLASIASVLKIEWKDIFVKIDQEHDREIFKKGEELFSEQKKDYFYDHLIHGQTYFELQSEANDFMYFGNQTGNQFLNAQLQKQRDKYIKSLDELMEFISMNFFPMKGTRYELYPELLRTVDYDKSAFEKFHKYKRALVNLSKKMNTCYKAYRSAVKRSLRI